MLLQIKSSFLHLKLLFIILFLKFKKLALISSKPWESQPKWSKRELVNTINNTAEVSQTKEILTLEGPLKFYDNILTELHKDVKNFARRGNLTYFSKNCHKYTKNKYIFNIITNGLKLNLKKLPTHNSRSIYTL